MYTIITNIGIGTREDTVEDMAGVISLLVEECLDIRLEYPNYWSSEDKKTGGAVVACADQMWFQGETKTLPLTHPALIDAARATLGPLLTEQDAQYPGLRDYFI